MSGVRRPRRARKPRAPRLPGGTYGALAAEGDDLEAAANVIADEARRLASWSRQISTGIHVDTSGDGKSATVWSEVGPAYPAETRARHPLFGNRKYWYGPPGTKFLGPAADAKAGDAMDRYAKKLDRLLAKAGFDDRQV